MISEREIKRVHQSMEGMTSYLARSIEEHLHLKWVYDRLRCFLCVHGDKFHIVLDMGCGIGLLGAYLMCLKNVGYIGVDKEIKFLKIGGEMFERLGFVPGSYAFVRKDIRKDLTSPVTDIFTFTGYEDEFGDYQRLYEVCLGYKDVFLSIIGREMWEHTIKVGCDPPFQFISEREFETIFREGFSLVEKFQFPGGRVMYWLRGKDQL